MGEVYRGKADVVLASGPSANAPVGGDMKAIRIPERPWDECLYPKFVAAAKEAGLAGYAAMDSTARRFDSDTGELSLDYGRVLLTLNAARTQGAVGRLNNSGPIQLDAMEIRCETEFAAIVATSLDGEPIGASRRLLITAVGRAENTSQGFWPPEREQAGRSPMAWMLPGEGRPPVIAEPIRASLSLSVPGPARVYRLDATGKRDGQLASQSADGSVRFDPAEARSIWMEVVVD